MDSSPDAKFFQMRKENSAGHGRRGSFSRSISTTEFDDNEVSKNIFQSDRSLISLKRLL